MSFRFSYINRLVALCFMLFAFCMGAKGAAACTDMMEYGENNGTMTDTLRPHDTDSLCVDSIVKPKKKKGSLLKRFIRNFDDFDNRYIIPNYYNYTFMLQNTNFQQIYRMKGTSPEEKTQMLEMSPESAFKIGPYFGWRWIFLGYTVDVAHPRKVTKAQEFSLSLYSSMMGVDFVYIKNDGEFSIGKSKGFPEDVSKSIKDRHFPGMNAYTFGLNVYYVFNHKRFSYPAAYAQSTVQRRSQGSWVLGLSYSHHKVSFDYTLLPEELLRPIDEHGGTLLIDELKINRINYKSFTVNGGYAYNWVFAPHWLFSISATPALGIKQAKGEPIKGADFWVNMKRFNFDFIGRAGLVWNNSKYFAGVSAVTHIYDYKKADYSLSNFINYINIYAGFMFHRKSQYRRTNLP